LPPGSTHGAARWLRRAFATLAAAILIFVAQWAVRQVVTEIPSWRSATRANEAQSLTTRAFADAINSGFNTAFLAWVQRRMLASSSAPTYRFLSTPAQLNGPLRWWQQFQLTPARQVYGNNADWLVIYGVPAAGSKYKAIGYPKLVVFQPGFELAERRR
jgi:hypothetical protein